MDGSPYQPECGHAPERRQRIRLTRGQAQFGPDPRPAHGPQCPVAHRRIGQRTRTALDLEAQPRGVAGQPVQPGRIVDERRVVQHPQHARGQILDCVRHGPEWPARQRQSDGVDGHVAPAQILGHPRRQDLG